MKDKIQKLCKRLNRFTLEEIALIAELDEFEMNVILQGFVKENILSLHDNNYIYNNVQKEITTKKRLPIMFQHHKAEEIDMIMNCFCAEVPSPKTALILSPSENCICNFNLVFRKKIYEKQRKELLQKFKNNPKSPRIRKFFDKNFYFYYYNNFLYVSEELLKNPDSRNFSKNEIRQFKIMHCWLNRRLNHNSSKYYTGFHIAEQIWRYGKDFATLKEELIQNLQN